MTTLCTQSRAPTGTSPCLSDITIADDEGRRRSTLSTKHAHGVCWVSVSRSCSRCLFGGDVRIVREYLTRRGRWR